MLDIKLKVVEVNANKNCSCHVEVFAQIEFPETEEEKFGIKSPIVMEPVIVSDRQMIERDMHRIQKSIVKTFEEIGMMPRKRREPQTMVVFAVTREQFNMMGRPTVGDYLNVETVTEKPPENESEADIPPPS